MLFNSLTFAVFLVVGFCVYRLVQRWRWPRVLWLLFISYLFYASWDARYLVLIGFSTVLDYTVGIGLGRAQRTNTRRALLAASLLGNLALLGVFKYGNFAFETLEALGAPEMPRVPGQLPVGISFYTFQTLSYTIDLYRRRIGPARNLVEFALYVAFFPQLVAGPIVRAKEFLPQLDHRPRLDRAALGEGIFFILAGLVKKMVIADSLREIVVGPFFSDPGAANAVETLVATWIFYFSLYCDFSGYTDVALGAALLFGFQLPKNFDRPALALSPMGHWRRWHISLHDWLFDYVFVPLGGSRTSRGRAAFNIVATFTIGGIWHGAGWTYLVMGVYNGVLCVVWRALRPRASERPVMRVLEGFLSFNLVAVSMVFMWPYDWGGAWAVLERLTAVTAGFSGSIPSEAWPYFLLAVGLHVSPRGWRDQARAWFAEAPAFVVATAVVVVAGVCSLFVRYSGEFYYFQF